MSIASLLAITPWPFISALLWFVFVVVVLYLARRTAHQAIRTATGALAHGLRLAAHSIAHAEVRLAARNREVLLAAGREAKERVVEREFERVGETVRKDLTNYPALHRTLSEEAIRRRARAWGPYQNLAVHYLLAGMRLTAAARGGEA